jgi:hypothetical protein
MYSPILFDNRLICLILSDNCLICSILSDVSKSPNEHFVLQNFLLSNFEAQIDQLHPT